MKIAKCLVLLVISSFSVNVMSIGLNGLIIPSIKMTDYSLVSTFSTLFILCTTPPSGALELLTRRLPNLPLKPFAARPGTVWGAENSVFDNGIGTSALSEDALASTSVAGERWDLSHVDWGQAAHAVFRSSANNMWLSSDHASVLAWLAMWITSPIYTLLYYSSAWVGQLTLIIGGMPASVVHGGDNLWVPAIVGGVIGGLVNVPSVPSVLYAWLAASFSMFAGNFFEVTCGIFRLPGWGLAYSLSAVVFTTSRYVRFATVPVDIAEATSPEDHLCAHTLELCLPDFDGAALATTASLEDADLIFNTAGTNRRAA